MGNYKIKGKGAEREVYDGDRLVGRLERFKRDEAIVSWGTRRDGSIANVTMRKVWKACWKATWPDGSPVLSAKHECHRLTRPSLKAWSWPVTWEQDARPQGSQDGS